MKIITIDIGGTNTRFGLFNCSSAQLVVEEIIWLSSQEGKSFEALFAQLLEKAPNFNKNVKAIGIAAAGMKQSQSLIQPTNLPWVVDLQKLKKAFPDLAPAYLFNDFEAQAFACASDLSKNFKILYKGSKKENMNYPIGVIGAGTGLGYAGLFLQNEKPLFVPSELGQQTFFFHAHEKLEQDFAIFLCNKKQVPYLRGDDILSGSGLAYLHEFLTKTKLLPEEVPLNSEAYTYFSKWYGRAVRNLYFAFLPESIVISGGIGAKHPEIFNKTFFESCFSAYIYQENLKNIDIYLNSEENAALWGVAYALQCKM